MNLTDTQTAALVVAAWLSDGRWAGVVIVLAMLALCLYAAWELRHAVLIDTPEQEAEAALWEDTPIYAQTVREMPIEAAMAVRFAAEVEAHLRDGSL